MMCEKCKKPSKGSEVWDPIKAPENLVLTNTPFKMSVDLQGNYYNLVAYVCSNNTAVVKRGTQWYLFDPQPKKIVQAWIKKFGQKATIMFYQKGLKDESSDESSSDKDEDSY